MSKGIKAYKPGDLVKLFTTGEVYEVIKHEGIFVKTRNLKTGYGRTFSLVEIIFQTSAILF